MDTSLIISPVIFAVAGLLLLIVGLFQSKKVRLILTLLSLLPLGWFFYALLRLRSGNEFAYTPNMGTELQVSFYSSSITFVSLNLLGLILWLIATLDTAFSANVSSSRQKTILVTAALIMLTGLLVYSVLGFFAGAICFPILTIGFYIAYRVYKPRHFHQP